VRDEGLVNGGLYLVGEVWFDRYGHRRDEPCGLTLRRVELPLLEKSERLREGD
jgi:hypothetical protein